MFAKYRARRAAAAGARPGADPRANTPEVHMNVMAPAAMRDVDAMGDELDVRQARDTVITSTGVVARLGQGRTLDVSGEVALGDERGTAANVHLGRGAPDARRTGQAPSGNPAAPVGGIHDETRTNARLGVVSHPSAPPERVRQGFTGSDPTRAAAMVVAHTVRPFDKAIAEHPPVLSKVPMPAPTASRPPERGRLLGARASALGHSGTGMLPVGENRPTVRQAPGPWAAGQVSDSATVSPDPGRRAAGWRLR